MGGLDFSDQFDFEGPENISFDKNENGWNEWPINGMNLINEHIQDKSFVEQKLYLLVI